MPPKKCKVNYNRNVVTYRRCMVKKRFSFRTVCYRLLPRFSALLAPIMGLMTLFSRGSVSMPTLNTTISGLVVTAHAVIAPVTQRPTNISSVVEFQRWWVLKSKLFGQESTCHQGKIFKKFLQVMTVCQILGIILESKVVQKLSLEKKVFNK